MIREYTALDLETTGLSASRDRILEIGALRVQDGVVTDTYHTLVDCQMKIPWQITRLTGITEEMMEAAREKGEAPKACQAVEELLDFCGQRPVLGHNILFDYSFIKHQAVNQGEKFEVLGIDTLKIARRFLAQLPSRSLESLCGYYRIEQRQSHRAVDDAYAAHLLYEKLAKDFEEADEKAFLPKPLVYQAKKQGPATKFQKAYLIDLVKYHRIELDVDIESLTKNEASRLIDRLLTTHGRIKR
ncbi:MAG: exonuclease domain-containing protein [Eubacteriales bacterium]|nr:exonuclease domain-containing protein [Eubacteriales bacterium]